MTFDREHLRAKLAALAQRGVFLGTSSWKYPGWRGLIYDDARYVWRGRFSEARFDRLCLAEYAEVFPTVCVDAAYYQFPDERSLAALAAQVPADFQFSFKVTGDITIKRFAALPRFGARAGQPNSDFLNADRFAASFLAPLEAFRQNIGLLMFEFSTFSPADFARGRDFVAALDGFLGQLPRGWRYGVEIRNRTFLHPDYFAALARHGVTHVFNNWHDMPSVAEQLALPGARTNGGLCGARFLLQPGRKYAEAVKLFSPYHELKEVNDEGRAAAAQLIQETARAGGKSRVFIYVNNRFEGSAPLTIAAMIEQTAGCILLGMDWASSDQGAEVSLATRRTVRVRKFNA